MRTWLNWLYARSVLLPTLAWNVLLGRLLRVREWTSRVDDHVVLAARPWRGDVPKMAADGVRAVVNLCEEFKGPRDLYKQFGIEQLWLPTIDFTHPSLADVQRGVGFIQDHVARGETVYVHCKAGRGRSATVTFCWLVKHREMTAQQAQDWLLKCRPHVNRHLTERPVIQAFIEQLSRESSSPAGESKPAT